MTGQAEIQVVKDRLNLAQKAKERASSIFKNAEAVFDSAHQVLDAASQNLRAARSEGALDAARLVLKTASQTLDTASQTLDAAKNDVRDAANDVKEAEDSLKEAEAKWNRVYKEGNGKDDGEKKRAPTEQVETGSNKKPKNQINILLLQSIEVKGCGIGAANGTYKKAGTFHDASYFERYATWNGVYDAFRLFRNAGGYWRVSFGKRSLYTTTIQIEYDVHDINKVWTSVDPLALMGMPRLEVEGQDDISL